MRSKIYQLRIPFLNASYKKLPSSPSCEVNSIVQTFWRIYNNADWNMHSRPLRRKKEQNCTTIILANQKKYCMPNFKTRQKYSFKNASTVVHGVNSAHTVPKQSNCLLACLVKRSFRIIRSYIESVCFQGYLSQSYRSPTEYRWRFKKRNCCR